MNFEENLAELLADLRGRLAKSQKELATLPEGSLVHEIRNKADWYFHFQRMPDGRRKRKLIEEDGATLKGLLRRCYLQREIYLLEKDAKLLNGTLESFASFASDDILKQMPERFKKFPREYFFPQPEESDWASQPYEQSSYMPERKIHTTSRGLLVRSKSELAISEAFYKYEVPFRYEQLLEIGAYKTAPDFMPRNKRTGEQLYWEHCGMPENEEYMKHHKWKMNLYESVGIVPWKNLIVSYDGEDGTLNIAEIESVIKNKLL